ncbi:MAG: L-serine ammonia-lyase, iron-sulfur-dependent subunit beta [Oscillospiraceae bacterium]
MHIFDIMGPIMIGPSSSHTAGAARIGRITQKLLGEEVAEITVLLHGSFAATGVGHGTDKALVAGLLGLKPDSPQLPFSFSIAREKGIPVTVGTVNLRGAHPNTAVLRVVSRSGARLEVNASSLGGGRVRVNAIDGLEAAFTGDCPTLIIRNEDRPGQVAEVTGLLSDQNVNLATMQLYRDRRGGLAVMVLESDQPILRDVVERLRGLSGIVRVVYLDMEEE